MKIIIYGYCDKKRKIVNYENYLVFIIQVIHVKTPRMYFVFICLLNTFECNLKILYYFD